MGSLVPSEVIEKHILIIRNQKVMLDRDLAMLYGVETRVLNQAVRRNICIRGGQSGISHSCFQRQGNQENNSQQ